MSDTAATLLMIWTLVVPKTSACATVFAVFVAVVLYPICRRRLES